MTSVTPQSSAMSGGSSSGLTGGSDPGCAPPRTEEIKALAEAVGDGRIKPGDLVAMEAVDERPAA